LTYDDFSRFDVAYEEGLTMFDCERVMLEQGQVVGTTAIFNDSKKIEDTKGRLPAGYFPF
jgi:hypothetical protein